MRTLCKSIWVTSLLLCIAEYAAYKTGVYGVHEVKMRGSFVLCVELFKFPLNQPCILNLLIIKTSNEEKSEK